MDTLSRLRHRWPRRSAIPVPVQSSSKIHNDPQSLSSSSPQHLCQRCDKFQLLNHIERPWTTCEDKPDEERIIGTIDELSLRQSCSLCPAWSNLMLHAATTYAQEDHSPRRCFELWTGRARFGAWKGTYFSVHFTQLNRKLFLFPTQTPSTPLPSTWASQPSLHPFYFTSELSVPRQSFYGSFDPSSPDFCEWIESCRSGHSVCSQVYNFKYRGPKRLIDCEQKQLCTVTSQSYVCLSYVWGSGSESNTATGINLPVHLPQVVSDAMVVVLKLGMRYLWVDRYCINQGDAQEKHDEVLNMGAICKFTRPSMWVGKRIVIRLQLR